MCRRGSHVHIALHACEGWHVRQRCLQQRLRRLPASSCCGTRLKLACMLHCAHLAHRINTDKRTHHTTPQQQPTWHILHDKVDALLILAAAVHAHQQRVVQQAQDVALAAQVGDLRREGVAGEGGRGKGCWKPQLNAQQNSLPTNASLPARAASQPASLPSSSCKRNAPAGSSLCVPWTGP